MAKRQIFAPKAYDKKTFSNILHDLENRLTALESSVKTYTITNAGSDVRSLDVTAATLTDVKNFLATLVKDLQDAGKLGKS